MIFRFKADAFFEADDIDDALAKLSRHFKDPKGFDPFMAPSVLEVEKIEKLLTTSVTINKGDSQVRIPEKPSKK